MNLLSTDKLEKSRVALEIEVPEEEFGQALTAAYKKNAPKITVPGFRKGKAPRKMIEQFYGESVFFEDAVNASYPKAYEDAVKEAGIDPVGRADVEVIKLEKTGYTFKATVPVKPEVTLGDYKGLTVTRKVVEVTDEMVDEEITKLRERNSRLIDAGDRAVKDGDTVLIDYSGSVNGEKFQGGTAEKQTLKIGSGQFIPGFEEKVIGKKAGEEFDIDVKFPEDYHANELAGKDAVFAIKLHEVKETELPDLDDEFVKDISTEFDTVDAFKEDLKKKMQADADAKSEQEAEDKLIDKIVEGMTVELPDAMIEQNIDQMTQEFDQRLRSQGLELATYLQITGNNPEDFRKNFTEEAEKRAKVRLALEKIVEAEEIKVSAEDIDAEYTKLADQYKIEIDKIKTYIPEEELTKDIQINKAIDLIKETAKIRKSSK
ncbi:MAG: trigger factor [Bacillota bacterium]|nr:trigger factor [Bacillota bacterium]